MTIDEEARTMMDRHGARAQQIAVDDLVVAIRRGDDAAAARLGQVLQRIEAFAIGGHPGREAPVDR